MKLLPSRHLTLALCLVALCATTALARNRLYRYNIATLASVTSTGSADDMGGKKAPVKIYKDSLTGIVTQVGQGIVTNAFGFNRFFANRGLKLTDPTTGKDVTATSDLEVITFRQLRTKTGIGTSWWAAEVRTYDPALAPPDSGTGSSGASTGASGTSTGTSGTSTGTSGTSTGTSTGT